MADARTEAMAEIRRALAELALDWSESEPGLFLVTLPGTRKLRTECALAVGRYQLGIRAFVARNPDQDHEVVYRRLLERNLKLSAVAFSVDADGDIHLTGGLPLAGVTAAEIDRVLGIVADTADSMFNIILELGFADSIRREWAWRRSRGESTANLAAFRHLDPAADRERRS
ncbi:type III secretion system chaperone family protein [Microlunatus parietis]|uniref:Sensory transduction regulator n=1 Tax=Microlunatus parietis TaxID=682979 RepID=A0A7Y9IBK2_9ACTN|nr:YbjN domain-containing protein [Microlunatus parietis]NYE73279.1 hypothetical protein [Microlunatus parietis]